MANCKSPTAYCLPLAVYFSPLPIRGCRPLSAVATHCVSSSDGSTRAAVARICGLAAHGFGNARRARVWTIGGCESFWIPRAAGLGSDGRVVVARIQIRNPQSAIRNPRFRVVQVSARLFPRSVRGDFFVFVVEAVVSRALPVHVLARVLYACRLRVVESRARICRCAARKSGALGESTRRVGNLAQRRVFYPDRFFAL